MSALIFAKHCQLGCMLASDIGVAIMGKEEGSVGKCNEGDKIREELYNVKQKYIESGVWTKELDNIMMEQDKHFDHCLNLDDDMPLLIRKSSGKLMKTRGTNATEGIFAHQLEYGSYGGLRLGCAP